MSRRPYQINSPWSPSETNKRGDTAPRSNRCENIFIPTQVPTSLSKYSISQMGSIPIKSSNNYSISVKESMIPKRPNLDRMKSMDSHQNKNNASPLPEEIHVWEEGSKRPRTQNVKFRRVDSNQDNKSESFEVFPSRPSGKREYEVPIVIMKNKKEKKTDNKKQTKTRFSNRPMTIQGKSFLSTLDKEFLDLFQL